MPKTINKKIGGHEFRIERIPVFEALFISGELQRVFGPAAASLAAVGTDGNGNIPVSMLSGMLMDSAEALARNLDGQTLVYLVKMVLREDSLYVKKKGTSDFISIGADDVPLYIDNTSDLLELALASFKHNFEELFNKAAALITSGPLGSKVKQAKATATEATESSSTSPLDN